MSANGASALTTAWRLGIAWAKVRLLGRQVPLLMSWNLTFRCNLRCHYCDSPNLDVPELDTGQVLEAIDDFYDLGTRYITFSGGEPLLRKDLAQIVNYAKDKGIVVFISTNGWLLPKRLPDLTRVDRFTISLDGGKDVHDAIRGSRAFDKAVAGIEAAQAEGIPVALTCVLATHNTGDLANIDELLDLARTYGAYVMFQPATKWLDSSTRPNPVAPDTGAYHQAIDYLIQRKKAGAPITNSVAGLRVLRHWPDPTPVYSTAGKVTCSLEPDGKILASHLTQTALLEQPVNGATPAENYRNMPMPDRTDQPWCGPILELDLLFSLRPSAILNAIRVQV